MSQDRELERFKREVNLAEVAQSLGYQIDAKASSKTSLVLRSGGDKVIVATDKKDGHGIYFSVGDERDCGSVVDFVQRRTGGNLGQVRKELRQWLPDAAKPSPKRLPAAERLEKPKPVERDRAQLFARSHRHEPYKGRYLTDERCIHPQVIEAFNVLQDERGNAVFRHFDQRGLSGWEVKNKAFTGFAAGGEKGVSFAYVGPADKPVTKVVITESTIDAMSHCQLRHKAGERAAYVSTGGAMNEQQRDLLRKVIERHEQAKVVLATDADEPGRKMARDIQAVVPKERQVERHEPVKGKDFNDELRFEVQQRQASAEREQERQRQASAERGYGMTR